MIALCIASRGRPDSLRKAILAMDRLAVLDDTLIIVALDDDDKTVCEAPVTKHKLIWSVGPREDSLGEKYNRCRNLTDADVCVLACDDGEITTQGWDKIIAGYAGLFSDGVGVIEFGKSGALPCVIAVTKGMSDRLGFFCPPYFPVWFHETWINEVALLCGRLLTVSDLDYFEYPNRKTQNIKSVGYWAEFFDRTRPWREKAADTIARELEAPYRVIQLRGMAPQYRAFFEQRNSVLRDPSRAQAIENHYSLGDADMARHDRLKKQAETLLG